MAYESKNLSSFTLNNQSTGGGIGGFVIGGLILPLTYSQDIWSGSYESKNNSSFTLEGES